MQGVLTPTIQIWSFGSLKGLPSPYFGSVSVIFTLFQKWGCDKLGGIIPCLQKVAFVMVIDNEKT
jgi:hypothetical protein